MIFPVADNAADSEAAARQRDAEALQAGRAGSAGDSAADAKPGVLVVEDNDDVRELAVTVLGIAGYRVLSAASGEQALAMLEDGAEVGMLFTDVIMPGGMNGLELIDRVRKLHPELPALVTTGYMDDLPDRGGSGELKILAKPYRHETLLEQVQLTLKNAA